MKQGTLVQVCVFLFICHGEVSSAVAHSAFFFLLVAHRLAPKTFATSPSPAAIPSQQGEKGGLLNPQVT
jgi:hypothetical protein